MEAKYIAAMHATKEALWLYTFLVEITCPLTQPIMIHLDNISTISITKNDRYHPCTKHIDIWYRFICHTIQQGLIHVNYTVTPKTLSILIPNVVWEVHHLTVWEFHLALVELYIVHTLGYKISPCVMWFGPQGVEIWSIQNSNTMERVFSLVKWKGYLYIISSWYNHLLL